MYSIHVESGKLSTWPLIRPRAPGQGIGFQHADGIDDLAYPRHGIVGAIVIEVIEYPLAIVCDFGCQFDTRHRSCASFRAAGCCADGGSSIFGKRARIGRVLKKLGLRPSQAIYVGDQLTDADAARAAGVAFGAVCWGYGAPQVLAQASPEVSFETVDELRLLACRAPTIGGHCGSGSVGAAAGSHAA